MPKGPELPTRNEVAKILRYDPETGFFYRLNRKKGLRAGSLRSDGYRRLRVCGREIAEHRLAWLMHYGEWPKGWLDHIDGDPKNNRIVNLRLATPTLNAVNRRLNTNSTSGFRGVTWHAQCKRWQAQLGGKFRAYLGLFDCPAEAAAVVAAEIDRHYGADAWRAGR